MSTMKQCAFQLGKSRSRNEENAKAIEMKKKRYLDAHKALHWALITVMLGCRWGPLQVM